MQALINYQKKLIEQNKKAYGLFYEQLRKTNYYTATEAEIARSKILDDAGSRINYAFNGTKPFAHDISPGCKLCGEGQWSCLFVNNRCNCNCFYCPAPQIDTGIPETQGFNFLNPDDYVEYIRKFNFKGVSLSGGEPLLTFETTLDFLKKIKKAFGDTVYLWMYTNGTLLTEEKAKKLADSGLDEIRFDLTATDYNTKMLRMALGKIPCVTVEIPAIPEEIELLKKAVIELDELGVNYLNLHQMRLTPYNLNNLQNKEYTFLHGPKVTVMESELTALEINNFVFHLGLRLPVNYCSFHYKNHYQKSAFRKKILPLVSEPFENITENGYLRRIVLTGDSIANETIRELELKEGSEIPDPPLYMVNGQYLTNVDDLETIDLNKSNISIQYFSARASELPMANAVETKLTATKSIFIEKYPAGMALEINQDEKQILIDLMKGKTCPAVDESETLFEIAQKEIPASGFAEYF
jgi:pyruvate formate-lyase activating enzyme-like uncharacterized protein